ncbi:MAG: hypothetical protein ACYS32_05620 [Planctomycetota bacterium]|jgi:hypothetical protein
MRTLFIPLAKLLGIYEIFRSLTYFLIGVFRSIRNERFIDIVIVDSPTLVIIWLLALILIFKAEKIADILRIPQDKTDSLVLDYRSILPVGLVLIGASMFIRTIPTLLPSLISLAIEITSSKPTMFNPPVYFQLSITILRIVLGGCLVLKADRLAQLLSKNKEQT